VVVGVPSIRPDPATGRGDPAGLAARIALATAAAGSAVQLAGTVGDDPAGDEVMLTLARAGVRHDAVLRDPDVATPLEPEDPALEAEARVPSGAVPVGIGTSAETGHRTVGAAPAPAPALDAADLGLCLSYLREFAVIVVAEPLDPSGLAAIAGAAAFAGAELVVVARAGWPDVDVPLAATVLEAPEVDPDDEFARLVARFAISLERGADPGDAFRAALAGTGWEAVGNS
jgi:hypothetical protein